MKSKKTFVIRSEVGFGGRMAQLERYADMLGLGTTRVSYFLSSKPKISNATAEDNSVMIGSRRNLRTLLRVSGDEIYGKGKWKIVTEKK